MAKKIEQKDIIQKDIFQNTIDNADLLLVALDELDKKFKSLAKDVKKGFENVDFSSSQGLKELTAGIEQARVATKGLADIEKEKAKIDKEREKLAKQLAASTDEEIKGKLRLQKANKEQRDLLRAQLVLENEQAGTLQKLAARNTILRKEREKLNLETKEGQQRLKEINDQLDDNNAQIKENSDLLKKQRINVGNYAESVKEAAEELNVFEGEIGGAIAGVRRFGRALLKSPIVAVATALAGLGAAFNETEEGNEKARVGFAQLQAVFGAIVGSIGSFVGELFTLGEALASPGLFGQNIKSAVAGLGSSFTGLGQRISDAVKSAKELETATIELEKVTRDYETEIANLRREQELQTAIADDNTRSFRERNEAAREAARLTLEVTDRELEFARAQQEVIQGNIDILESNNQSAKAERLRQTELKEINLEVLELEKERVLTIQENNKRIAELRQDELERDLDFLLDGFDNQKTINERRINDERLSAEERKKILDQTVKDAEASFKKQIATLEELSAEGVDIEGLLDITDPLELAERIRQLEQSEIIEGRTLEVLRDRKTAIQDLKELQRELNDEIRETENATRAVNLEAQIDFSTEETEANIQRLREAIFLGDAVDLNQVEDAVEAEFSLRREALIEQAAFEVDQAEDNAERIELIEATLNKDLAALDAQRRSQVESTYEELQGLEESLTAATLEQQELRREQLGELLDETVGFIDAVTQKIIEASQERQDAIQGEIDANEKRADRLRELADQGNTDAEQSLAELDAKRAQLEAERQREIERQRRIETGLAAIKTFSAFVDAGDEPTTALGKTTLVVSLLTDLISNLPGFYQGAENVSESNTSKFSNGRDGFLARLDGGERVLTSNDNRIIGDMSNTELTQLADSYNKGLFDMNAVRVAPIAVPSASSWQSNKDVLNKFDSLEKAINRLDKDVSYHYDELEKSLIQKIESKNKVERRHFKQGGIW